MNVLPAIEGHVCRRVTRTRFIKRTHLPGVFAIVFWLATPVSALTQGEITTQAFQLYTGHANLVAPWTGSINQYLNGVPPTIPAYEAQLLAWGETYVGMTQRTMYAATGNTQHLNILLNNAEVMYANRADRLTTPLIDEVRNVIMPAFISFNEAQGALARQHAWLVHSAFPSQPLLLAIESIKNDPSLQLQYGDRVNALLADIIQTMDSFDSEFYTFSGDRGAYYEPYLHFYGPSTNGQTPYNMQNAAGLAYIGLWKYTGDTRFRDRAEALAKTFKDELTSVSDRYQWRYAPYNSVGSVSDIAHAGLDVNFVIEAYEAGIVFDDTDIQRLVNTMRQIQKDSGFTATLNGSGAGSVTNSQSGTLWLKLTNYDASLRQEMYPVFQTYWNSTIGLWPALGAAQFYESGQHHIPESEFSDEFDGYQISRRWVRDPNQLIGDTWTTQVSDSGFAVIDIQTSNQTDHWVDIRRDRAVVQDDTWEVAYDFTWDSSDPVADPLQAMQRFYVELHDPLGQLIARVGVDDGWNQQAGGRVIQLFGESILEPFNSIGLLGTASIRITSDAAAAVSRVYWDDVLLLTVPQAVSLDQISMVLGHFYSPTQPTHFGKIAVQSLSVFDTLTQLVGDLDGDGFVGIADLNIVLGAWNQNVTAGNSLLGDPSGDGFVGIDDLNTVLGNWNTGTPPLANTQLPEPGALITFLLASGTVIARRHPA